MPANCYYHQDRPDVIVHQVEEREHAVLLHWNVVTVEKQCSNKNVSERGVLNSTHCILNSKHCLAHWLNIAKCPISTRGINSCTLCFLLRLSTVGAAAAKTPTVESNEQSHDNKEGRRLEQQIKAVRHVCEDQVPKRSELGLHV